MVVFKDVICVHGTDIETLNRISFLYRIFVCIIQDRLLSQNEDNTDYMQALQ